MKRLKNVAKVNWVLMGSAWRVRPVQKENANSLYEKANISFMGESNIRHENSNISYDGESNSRYEKLK